MRTAYRFAVVLVLLVAVATILTLKRQTSDAGCPCAATLEQSSATCAVAGVESNGQARTVESTSITNPLPRLVDLGADRCIPCKMMAPILKELRQELTGTCEVEFIDVWENPEAAESYAVRVIPTQIFYDAAGTELFRHEGFFGKAEILSKWKELGIAVPAGEE